MKKVEYIVESMKDEIVSLLQRMVQIPSENPPGDYTFIAQFLENELERLGFKVTVVDAADHDVLRRGVNLCKPNVIGVLPGMSSGPVLIFNAHIDTVPAGNAANWRYNPFLGMIDNGRVYGRGATDSKARLAAYISAAVALKRLGLPMYGSVVIAATCDEETGGVLGAGFVTQQGIAKGDMVIVEGYSNQIVRAMAGVLQLRITVQGKAAHAGFKWNGVNAVEKMANVVSGLEQLQTKYKQRPSAIPGMRYTTVNVGVIRGGTKVNVVPGECEVEVDFRVVPEQSLDEVYGEVETLIEHMKQNDPEFHATIETLEDFNTQPTVVDEGSPLISKLQSAQQEVHGDTLPVVGIMGQTDGRWFIEHGMPTISYGPGRSDNNLHGYDEFIEIDDLVRTTKVLAVFAQNELCKKVNNNV